MPCSSAFFRISHRAEPEPRHRVHGTRTVQVFFVTSALFSLNENAVPSVTKNQTSGLCEIACVTRHETMHEDAVGRDAGSFKAAANIPEFPGYSPTVVRPPGLSFARLRRLPFEPISSYVLPACLRPILPAHHPSLAPHPGRVPGLSRPGNAGAYPAQRVCVSR